jgi:hypothetical protein
LPRTVYGVKARVGANEWAAAAARPR